MSQYSITLPDGTCVEGDEPHYVLQMARVMRDGYEDEADEDSKTLQERVDEAFGSDDDCFSKSIFEHGDKLIQITDAADGTLEQNSGFEVHHSCTEEW